MIMNRGARQFLAWRKPAQAGFVMVARGFSRRAGRRVRKRLGYNDKGRLCGLKTKTLTDTPMCDACRQIRYTGA
jgi:hypothetical protein